MSTREMVGNRIKNVKRTINNDNYHRSTDKEEKIVSISENCYLIIKFI